MPDCCRNMLKKIKNKGTGVHWAGCCLLAVLPRIPFLRGARKALRTPTSAAACCLGILPPRGPEPSLRSPGTPRHAYGKRRSSFQDSWGPDAELGAGCGAARSVPGSYSPVCRVCLPPESTPRGRVPVGVRPLRVSTLSLSSLRIKKKKKYRRSY